MAGYKEMAPGIFRMRQEERKGWIPFAMNLYALPGKRGLLFDAGSGARGAVAHVARALDAVEAMTERRVRRVLPSHAHWDHFSGASSLSEKRRMEVLLTPAMVPLVRTRQSYRKAYLDAESALLPKGNRLTEAARHLQSRLVDELFALTAGVRAVTGPYTPIAVGDTLETDSGNWAVLAGPGHCDAHIMLWNPESGHPSGGRQPVGRHHHLARPAPLQHRRLPEDLKGHSRPARALPRPSAHGRAITEPVKRATQLITHRRRRLAEVREKVEAAGPQGLNAHALVRHYYPHIGPLKRGIAQGWIESTLLHLMQEGVVARTAEKGLWRYRSL